MKGGSQSRVSVTFFKNLLYGVTKKTSSHTVILRHTHTSTVTGLMCVMQCWRYCWSE